jgi:hypothetical protein
VPVNGTCAVSVTFSPSATTNDPRTGTLSIADNVAGSPQTVVLSGTGWDFNLTAPATASTNPGTAAPITVTVNALGGFTGAVTLTCSGTIPQGTCTAQSGAVTAPGTGTVTVTSTASSLAPPGSRRIPPMSVRQIVLLLLVLVLSVALLAAGRTRTRIGLAGALLFCAILAGCGSSATTTPGTPAGSYAFVITGTAGGVSRTVSVTVTVN